MDALNTTLSELRETLSTEPLDWRKLRDLLLEASTLDSGGTSLDYIQEVLSISVILSRVAALEAVVEAARPFADTSDPQKVALKHRLDLLDEAPQPDRVMVSRERLDCLETIAAAGVDFAKQHNACWQHGGTFKMEVERRFRVALNALEAVEAQPDNPARTSHE